MRKAEIEEGAIYLHKNGLWGRMVLEITEDGYVWYREVSKLGPVGILSRCHINAFTQACTHRVEGVQ